VGHQLCRRPRAGAGATDRRLKAVVAQVPTISGYQQSLRRVAPGQVPALEASFSDDDRRVFAGDAPATQLVVSADPATPAAYDSPDAVAFYTQPLPEGCTSKTKSPCAPVAPRVCTNPGNGFRGCPRRRC